MDSATEGQLRLLFVAPERLEGEEFRRMLARIRVRLLTVDEAHCIPHRATGMYRQFIADQRAAGTARVAGVTAREPRRIERQA
jgi:superfamily II DNA helicase RecQ